MFCMLCVLRPVHTRTTALDCPLPHLQEGTIANRQAQGGAVEPWVDEPGQLVKSLPEQVMSPRPSRQLRVAQLPRPSGLSESDA